MTPPFIDPTTIDPTNNGRIIFTSQSEVVSDGIELREDGSWGLNDEVSHAMTLTVPGMFNCQDPAGFQHIPVKQYMTPGTKIYVFSFVDINPQAMQAWNLIVNERLGKQGYDWLQILGEAAFPIPLSFLHMPGTEDCSEENVREMKGIAPFMPGRTQNLINSIGNQDTPQILMNVCLNNPTIINFDGLWS